MVPSPLQCRYWLQINQPITNKVLSSTKYYKLIWFIINSELIRRVLSIVMITLTKFILHENK